MDLQDVCFVLDMFIKNPDIMQRYYKKHVFVNRQNNEQKNKFVLFVGNICFTQAEEDVKTLFTNRCEVKNFNMVNKFDNSGLLIKRFAFLEVFNREDMESILELDGITSFGRNLIIKKAD